MIVGDIHVQHTTMETSVQQMVELDLDGIQAMVQSNPIGMLKEMPLELVERVDLMNKTSNTTLLK